MIINKMTNNYYKVLSFMYDNKIILNTEYMIPFNQNEISEQIKINKVTINKLFKEYVEDELIYKKGSRYYLTEKCVGIIKKIKSIKD